jgi:hypothetical protein
VKYRDYQFLIVIFQYLKMLIYKQKNIKMFDSILYKIWSGFLELKIKNFNSKIAQYKDERASGIKNQQNMSFLAHFKFKLIYRKSNYTLLKNKGNYKQVFLRIEKIRHKKVSAVFCNEIKFLKISRHQFVVFQKCC